MWLDLAIALSAGGGGLVCGWIMYAMGGFGNYKLVKKATEHIRRGDVQKAANERIKAVAQRLREDAHAMAADVDRHQIKIQAVNNSLIEGDGSSREVVVQAVGELIEANEAMQTQLRKAQERIHEQTAQIESAERRANTDALTCIPNRAAFDNHIQRQHALGPDGAGTLAILDVDHFKQFNDVYGHRAGDEVLRVVARALHTRLQPYGLVARFGGEEFAVILDGYSVDQAKHLVEMGRTAIGHRSIEFEGKRLRVAASAGVAELIPGESIESWLQRADDGLYRSKQEGRDCGHWMDVDVPIRIESGDECPTALGKRFKPQADELTDLPPASNSDEPVGRRTPNRPAHRSALDDVSDRETLAAEFAEIRGRTHSSVSLFVMVIQCSSAVSNESMRSLLQIVRAQLRSVDRIGCGDDSTLLLYMPSIDAIAASEHAHQICRSAEAIGMQAKGDCEHQVSIGVAETHPDEQFAVVVSRATALAQQAQGIGSSPVRVEVQSAFG